jgi:hypothetical protein
MFERVMDISAVPAFLANALRSSKVKVRESNSVVTIEPIAEAEYRCPLRGIAKGGALTTDKFLAMKHLEKELEEANDCRLRS